MTRPGRIAFNDCGLRQIVFHAVCSNLTDESRKKRRVHLAAPYFAPFYDLNKTFVE